MAQGRRADLQGGGWVRSLGGWAAGAALRRGREASGGDERILGSPAFVDQRRREAAIEAGPPPAPRPGVPELLTQVCRVTGCALPALRHGSRRAPAARAREGLAYLAVEVWGYTGPAVAKLLGVRPSAVYRAAQRGRATGARWADLLPPNKHNTQNIRKQRPL